MRISDWSSDVCSSDLVFLKDIGAQIAVVTGYAGAAPIYLALQRGEVDGVCSTWDAMRITAKSLHRIGAEDREKAITTVFVQTEIGRASCRERVCQYV